MILLDLPHSRDYFTEIFTRRGLAPVVRHRFTSFEAVRAMVARGHGFTLLNQRPVHDLTYDGGRLVVIELEEEAGSLDIVLASAQPMRTLSRAAPRRSSRSAGRWSRRRRHTRPIRSHGGLTSNEVMSQPD